MSEDPRARRSRGTRAGNGGVLRRSSPWVVILLLTGGFHVLRGASVDAVIFLGIGGLLAADAIASVYAPRLAPALGEPLGIHGRGALEPGPWIPNGSMSSGVLGVGALVGVVLVVAPRYSAFDAVAVGALGLLLVPLVWPEPERQHADAAPTSSPSAAALRRTGILWSLVAVVASGWELSSFFLALPSAAAAAAHPALSDLVGPLADWMPTRAICVALWLLGGYALLRRRSPS